MTRDEAMAKLMPIFEYLESGLSKTELAMVAKLAQWAYRQGYADRWTNNEEDSDQEAARKLYDELINLIP